jgi:hypothetical protein
MKNQPIEFVKELEDEFQGTGIDPAQLMGSQDDIDADKNLFGSGGAVELAKLYLQEEVPQDIREESAFKKLWAVHGKKIQLSFLDQKDYPAMLDEFDANKILYLMSKPKSHFRSDEVLLLGQMKLHFMAGVKSAIGRGQVNERTMQNTQITQLTRSNTEQFSPVKSAGMLQKLTGWM